MPAFAPFKFSMLPDLSVDTFVSTDRILIQHLNGGSVGPDKFYSTSLTDLKAYFSDDTVLTGTPTAPTATSGTNTTQVATTAFVITERNTREPTITAGTTGQYWRGDKSWQTLNSTAVGLGNVENTALSTWAGSVNITTINESQGITTLSALTTNGVVTTSGGTGALSVMETSYGGFGFADSGKIPAFFPDGSLSASTVSAYSSGKAYPCTFMYPTSFLFVQTGGKTMYLQAPTLSTDYTITFPAATGTVALTSSYNAILDSISTTRGAVLYRGASGWAALGPSTSGYAIVSNGPGADPSYAAVSSGIVINSTSANGTAGNVLYTDGSKVQQYTAVPANKGGTGVSNNGTFTNASNTTITGGGTIALAGFTLTVPATGTAALLGIANTFTAANIFSVNGAASTPALSVTGAIFTGGSGTTTKPLTLIEPAGTASTTWSTSGTQIGINTAAGFAGNLLDLKVNNTSPIAADGDSLFRIVGTGEMRLGNGYWKSSGYSGIDYFHNIFIKGGFGLLCDSSSNINFNQDVYLSRKAAAALQLGLDVNADATDQTLKAADGITGTDRNGADLSIASGNSTGQGTSAIIFKTPKASSSGTTARTAAERARIDSDGLHSGNVIIWSDAAAAPASWPAAGYYVYVDPSDGNLKVMSSAGTVTTIALS